MPSNTEVRDFVMALLEHIRSHAIDGLERRLKSLHEETIPGDEKALQAHVYDIANALTIWKWKCDLLTHAELPSDCRDRLSSLIVLSSDAHTTLCTEIQLAERPVDGHAKAEKMLDQLIAKLKILWQDTAPVLPEVGHSG